MEKGRADIVITQHAWERMRERCPFRRRSLERRANQAFDCGLRPEEVECKDARLWLQSKLTETGDEVRVSGGFLFLFRFAEGEYRLVTVLVVPVEFRGACRRTEEQEEEEEEEKDCLGCVDGGW